MSSERKSIDWGLAKQQLQEAEAGMEGALNASAEKVEQVYRERAAKMAKRHIGAGASGRTIRVLVFSLGQETYGLPISDLAEVLASMKCTPAPRAPRELAGVINIRGELRSVIDLRRVLSLPSEDDESNGRILMIRNGDEEVGLKVGPVEKVQSIAENELALPESGAAAAASGYVTGVSPDRVIVLNTVALLSHSVFRTSSR